MLGAHVTVTASGLYNGLTGTVVALPAGGKPYHTVRLDYPAPIGTDGAMIRNILLLRDEFKASKNEQLKQYFKCTLAPT